MEKNKKGISLIVLAITIIVMIILASAIILSLSGKNMIGTAKEATSASDFANAKQAAAVAVAEWEMGEADGYTSLKAYAEAKLQEAGLIGFNVSNSGNVTKVYTDDNGKKALIPYGYVASSAAGEDTIENGLVIYEGTEEVNDKNVETARKERNQFVWVPVDNIDDFVRIDCGKGTSKNKTTSYDLDSTEEAIEYAEMYESVKENKGFYIARYEAGKEGTGTLVSKKNATVWTDMNWNDSKATCETLSTESVVSHLIYGEEWDAALTFISTRGVKDETYATNSTGKGNYTGSLLKTGSNEAYAKNNIYDMAGNVWERTMERYSATGRIERGGSYNYNGTDHPAAYRNAFTVSSASSRLGFRVALYLK